MKRKIAMHIRDARFIACLQADIVTLPRDYFPIADHLQSHAVLNEI